VSRRLEQVKPSDSAGEKGESDEESCKEEDGTGRVGGGSFERVAGIGPLLTTSSATEDMVGVSTANRAVRLDRIVARGGAM
jgi:hypothetical protein